MRAGTHVHLSGGARDLIGILGTQDFRFAELIGGRYARYLARIRRVFIAIVYTFERSIIDVRTLYAFYVTGDFIIIFRFSISVVFARHQIL